MQLAHNWASWENTRHSYELFARYVMPRFQDLHIGREASHEWARAHHDDFIGRARSAVNERVARHVEEKGADNIAPEILRNYPGPLKGCRHRRQRRITPRRRSPRGGGRGR